MAAWVLAVPGRRETDLMITCFVRRKGELALGRTLRGCDDVILANLLQREQEGG